MQPTENLNIDFGTMPMPEEIHARAQGWQGHSRRAQAPRQLRRRRFFGILLGIVKLDAGPAGIQLQFIQNLPIEPLGTR
jgi:hypothetical protein